MANADIEPLSGVIRVWANGSGYGDAYQWAASVRWLARDDIEILGSTSPITRDVWRAIMAACGKGGIKRILAVRYRAGLRTEKWIDVKVERKTMSISGILKTTLAQNGSGQVMHVSLECQSDGKPFFRGSVACEWADTKNDSPDNNSLPASKP